MLTYLLLLLGLIMLGVSFIVLFKRNKNWWPVIMLFGCVFLMLAMSNQTENIIDRQFAKDVDMTKIPVVGQKNFHAQVRIIYKDGKLDSVVLVPKTTVAE